MEKILKAIYDGELRIVEERDTTNPEYREAMENYLNIQQKIMDALPEDRKALVDEFSIASADVNGVVCQQDFARGYQLGALMMLAVFNGPLKVA
ncbi:MAG: hypothetical protein IJV04_06380 [Lachnospiraceae bacterium]|nr:hypothetical protein [Clostridia bacterium]MBQ8964831.1 hypothetical protein [Clostridia bacterium]MBQ9632520.1 hypothetical protein [Lachnospiraceae bacterium]